MFRKMACLISLIVSDIASLFSALYLAYLIRKEVLIYVYSGFRVIETPPFKSYLTNYPYFLGLWILVFAYEKLYTKRFLWEEEIKHLWQGASLSFIIIIVLTFVTRIYPSVSRTVIVLAWILSFSILPFFRLMVKKILIKEKLWQRNILILGAGKTGKMVSDRIKKNKSLGYNLVGFLDDDETLIGRNLGGAPVLGKVQEIKKWAEGKEVRDVIIAMPAVSREELLKVVGACEGVVENIRIIPDMFGLATLGVEAEDLDGILLFSMQWNLIRPHNVFIKRAVDLFFSGLGLIVASPLILFIAVAIKRDSEGPVIYAQERLGKEKSIFKLHKFRTMYIDGEEKLSKYLKKNPRAKGEWERFAKIKSGDPRVTRFGDWLRRWSLDELPQLINVLKGEMSLVGPRPYLLRNRKKMGEFIETIAKALPGVTGLWQVSGKNELTFQDRLKLDKYYVRNWSLWMDFVILLKTVKVVLRREGTY